MRKIKTIIKYIFAIKLLPAAVSKYLIINKYCKKERGNIAIVILVKHIGDIITCEPVSTYLKNTKGKKVVWIVEDSLKDILTMFTNVDLVVPVDCVTECVFLKRLLKRYEVHNLHFEPRYCSKYPFTLHNEITTYNYKTYLNYGSILSTFSVVGGLPSLHEKPTLRLDDADRFPEINYPFIALHLQANDRSREWEIKKWSKLVQSFPQYHFVEIGVKPLLNEVNCDSSYCGKMSLVDIAYMVRKSSVFVGIESAVAHYANALDIPSLILIGSYNNFEEYTPYSAWNDSFTMVRTKGLAKNLSVEIVQERLAEKIEQYLS